MRHRNSIVCVLAGSVLLAVVLSLVCHPASLAAAGTGMSAPIAPRPSVESASGEKLLHSHYDWSGRTPRPGGRAMALPVGRALDIAPPPARPMALDYPLLYRRPPPNFS